MFAIIGEVTLLQYFHCYWRKNPLFVCLFGFIWSNREKIGKSLGTCEGFCPIFISCSWQCHLKLHPFALAIKLLNHNRQENNGFFFLFPSGSFCAEDRIFPRRTATWNSLANNITLREHSLNCWHNWNEHAPDAYFDYNTFITGYRYWTILWILQLWIIHNDMTTIWHCLLL